MAADATRLLPDEESQLSEGLRHHEGDEDRLGRCRRCGRSCGGCCRFLWACCGEIWCGFGPEVCKLLCCPPLPSRITSKLAFAPPPPSYDVRLDSASQQMQLWLQREEGLRLFVPPGSPAPYTLHVDWLCTRSRQHVPALFIRPTRAARAAAFAAGTGPAPNPAQHGASEAEDTDYFVIFYSHANGTDLGEMLEFYVALVERLGVGVYAYEYTGYGAATGDATHESQCIQDATAAWQRLTAPAAGDGGGGHGVRPERVIIYGQSIGSGPATYLASEPGLGAGAAALILHAAVLSLIRVVLPIGRTLPIDPFPNIERMPSVRMPVAVIHGDADDMVPCSHGEALHAAAPTKLPPCWLRGAGHNDLALYPQYYQYLGDTVRGLAAGSGGAGGAAAGQAADAPAPSRMRR